MDFSIISTKPLPLNNGDSPVVKGKSCGLVYFSHVEIPSIEKAIEDALTKSGADYLTDVKVYRRSEYYFLWAKDCFVVEGGAGGIRSPKYIQPPEPYSAHTSDTGFSPSLPSYLMPKPE